MSAVSAPAEWIQPAPGSFISILGPRCPSKGQKKLLENLYPQEETPCLVSVSPNHTFFGGTLSIINYEVITFWISRNNLWYLPFLHYHLKTITRPKRNQSFHLRFLEDVFENPFWYFWGTELYIKKKKLFKKIFLNQRLNTQLLGTVFEDKGK